MLARKTIVVSALILAFATQSFAVTRTYEITFSDLNDDGSDPAGFFSVVGIAPVNTVVARFTFEDAAPVLIGTMSGSDYTFVEAATPWTALTLHFGSLAVESLPSVVPYTSIRVRDGIKDGMLDISDRVLIDAEFDYISPTGYEFTQALMSFFSTDEHKLHGIKVPKPDEINALADSTHPLTRIGTFSRSQDSFGPTLRAQSFFVSEISEDSFIAPSEVLHAPLPATFLLLLSGVIGLLSARWLGVGRGFLLDAIG